MNPAPPPSSRRAAGTPSVQSGSEPRSDPFRLDGELALITGGGTGLGLAMARCLAHAGARVVLTGRREEPLRQAAVELGAAAGYVVHDVTLFAQAPALAQTVTERFGTISILINNAGVHVKKPAEQTTEAEFQTVLDTHVVGAHALTRAVLPGMIQRRTGSLIYIASMVSLFGMPQVVAYGAAKSALVGMVRSLATELSPRGIRVNAIAPGWFETEITRKAMQGDPDRKSRILSRTPMGRFGDLEDVGLAAVYLCSPAAKFVTGVVLPVDGGASVGF